MLRVRGRMADCVRMGCILLFCWFVSMSRGGWSAEEVEVVVAKPVVAERGGSICMVCSTYPALD